MGVLQMIYLFCFIAVANSNLLSFLFLDFGTRVVFRTILKTHNLAPGDFPEIQSFASKLNDVKFSDFANFSQRQIDELDMVLNVEIPKLMSVRSTKNVSYCLKYVVLSNSNTSFY
jgi:hypothetical protein